MQRLGKIRRAQCGVLCALMVAYAPASRAIARQQTAANRSSGSSATTATTHSNSSKTPAKAKSGTAQIATKHSRRKKSARVRGQQKIDSERAREIQDALIREHYLTGAPTGSWNQASEDAMRRYQGDHGWQTKEVPDSRALIKLGLGPSKDHLLNPESAMTTSADAPRSESPAPTSQTAAPVSNAPAPTSPPSDSSSPQ
jgi:hypothetical protein